MAQNVTCTTSQFYRPSKITFYATAVMTPNQPVWYTSCNDSSRAWNYTQRSHSSPSKSSLRSYKARRAYLRASSCSMRWCSSFCISKTPPMGRAQGHRVRWAVIIVRVVSRRTQVITVLVCCASLTLRPAKIRARSCPRTVSLLPSSSCTLKYRSTSH